MNKMVDKAARLAAMENLAQHFLSLVYRSGDIASERRQRHEVATAQLVSCGDNFDAHEVMQLFYWLEERAAFEISKSAALAQTTDPDSMLMHGLPRELVENAKRLKEFNGRKAKEASASNARKETKAAKAKIAFQKWAKETIKPIEHSGKIQIGDVRAMKGFDSKEWEQKDKALKSWVREVFDGFRFRSGRTKK